MTKTFLFVMLGEAEVC